MYLNALRTLIEVEVIQSGPLHLWNSQLRLAFSEREKEKYTNNLLDDAERLREKICDDLDTDDEDEFDSDLDEDTVFCKLNC